VWVELRIVTADKLSIEIVGQCFGRSLSTGVVRNRLTKFQIEELSPGAIYHHSEKLGACLALVLSALVTLFGAWDAFFNHSALWPSVLNLGFLYPTYCVGKAFSLLLLAESSRRLSDGTPKAALPQITTVRATWLI